MFKKTIQLLLQARVNYYRLAEIAPWSDTPNIPFPWHLETVLTGVFDREWDYRDNGGYFKDENGILWLEPEISDEDADSTPSYFTCWYTPFYEYTWWEEAWPFSKHDYSSNHYYNRY